MENDSSFECFELSGANTPDQNDLVFLPEDDSRSPKTQLKDDEDFARQLQKQQLDEERDRCFAKRLQEHERRETLAMDLRLAQSLASIDGQDGNGFSRQSLNDEQLAELIGEQDEMERSAIDEDIADVLQSDDAACQMEDDRNLAEKLTEDSYIASDLEIARLLEQEEMERLAHSDRDDSRHSNSHESDDSPGDRACNHRPPAELFTTRLLRMRPFFDNSQWNTLQHNPRQFFANFRSGEYGSDSFSGDDYEELWDLADQYGEVKRRGLDANQLNMLPTKTYVNKKTVEPTEGTCGAAHPENTTCLVCQEDFQDQDRLRTLPCCHQFHLNCIDQWIQRNAKCPICQVELKEQLNAN